MRFLLLLTALAMPLTAIRADTPALENDALAAKVAQILASAPTGTRFGLFVTTLDGTPLLAIAPDQRFIPASNTKLVTTIAAYAQLGELDRKARGAGVRLEQTTGGAVDVILVGYGDAGLSSAPDCVSNCLTAIADAVAGKTRHVRDVIGDDRWFPDERWSPGMSWNNIQTRSGTGSSALTLDDNEVAITISPGGVGEAPVVSGGDYFRIDNLAVTVAGAETRLGYRREPNEMVLRLTGTIGRDAPGQRLRFGIDDPAHFAAWRLRAMLEARGVLVSGGVLTRHRPLTPTDDPAGRDGAVPSQSPEQPLLIQLPVQPFAEDIRAINKTSQNLHAELLLRQISRLNGSGSIADGQAALRVALAPAGLPANGVDLSDGSGMSTYNRITPRAAVALLGWAARQPWGAQWRETLPVGGQEGTMRRRFAGTALDGKIFAKTGSLNATNALSGYLIARGGQTLIFSILSNDCPDGETDKAVAAMDAALLAIAEN